jgi:hypothetical protein
MLFAAFLFLFICALSSKKMIFYYKEELIVAACFLGFILLTRKSFGSTFQETFDRKRAAALLHSRRSPFSSAALHFSSTVFYIEFYGLVPPRKRGYGGSDCIGPNLREYNRLVLYRNHHHLKRCSGFRAHAFRGGG